MGAEDGSCRADPDKVAFFPEDYSKYFTPPEKVIGYKKVTPNPQRLVEDQVGDDYIALTQRPNYKSEAAWQNEAERPGYIQTNKRARGLGLRGVFPLSVLERGKKGRSHRPDKQAGNRPVK